MIIVSDTGPILHLLESDNIHLLENVGNVYIPQSVSSELDKYWKHPTPEWIKIHSLQPGFLTKAHAWFHSGLLDSGEAECIALCLQSTPDWFLTDDSKARLMAQTFGIEVHGSLGVVLWAAAHNHLKKDESLLSIERLTQSSLWISPKIISLAHNAINTIFG